MRYILLLTVAAITLASCTSSITVYEDADKTEADLIATCYNAVDQLLGKGTDDLSRDRRVLVGTLVDLNNMERTSMFGRVMSELLSSRLTQRGYKVIQANIRDKSVLVRPGEGQFLLTRDMKELAQDYNVGAVFVGTYGRAGDKVYISVRIVNADYNTTSAAIDFDLPVGSRVAGLFGVSATALSYTNRNAPPIWGQSTE